MANYDYSELEKLILNKEIKKEECKQLCERLVYFADNFHKTFIEKVNSYNEEVIGNSTKLNKRTKIGTSATACVFGTATLISGLTYKLGSSAVNAISGEASGFVDTHRKKATDVTLKLENIFNNLQPIELAIKIFSIYEEQLMTVFKTNKEWLMNKQGLINDAVKKIMTYINETTDLELENIIINSLISINWKSGVTSLPSFKSVLKNSKSVAAKGYNEWTFERFNEKSGFVVKNDNQSIYFWNGNEHPKFGFKLVPFDLVKDQNEYKGEIIKQYKYLLDMSKLESIVRIIEEISAKHITGNAKDMHSYLIKADKKQQRNFEDLSKHVKEGKEINKTVDKKVDKVSNKVDEANKIVHEIKNILTNDEEERKGKEKVKFEEIISPIANFTGREDELKQIYLKLNSSEKSQGRIVHSVCICGLGGMGKTELSRKYIQVYREEYKSVYWINAENITYDTLVIKEFYEKEIKTKTSKILIVLDNAHKFDEVEPFFPKERMDNVFFLITSRSKKWDAQQEGEIQLVELTSFKEAYELVKNNLPNEERENINELIEILGGLPLALQQAIAYIKDRQEMFDITSENFTIKDYLKDFEENKNKLLDTKFSNYRYNLKTVYTTWNISLEQIKKEKNYGEEAVKIMQVMSYLKPSVDVTFLTEDNKFNVQAINILRKYLLINISEKRASVHRLVQEVIRIQIRKEHNLEATILRHLIFLKFTFMYANLNVLSQSLCEKPQIIKEYCEKTSIEQIPFYHIFKFAGKKIFETMVEQNCFNLEENNVKEAISNNIKYIFDKCDLNIVKKIMNKLGKLPKDRLYYLISCFIWDGRIEIIEYLSKDIEDNIERMLYKLTTLLCNKEKCEEVLHYLSEIKDNLPAILEIAPTHLKEASSLYFVYKDFFYIAIDCDHQGILKYFMKYLKQNETKYVTYAISKRKENAFFNLATKEYLESSKEILINGKNLFDYTCVYGTVKMIKHLECAGFICSNNLTFNMDFYFNCEFEVFKYVLGKNDKNLFDLKATDSMGRTILFYAARARRVDLTKYLIKNGLLVNVLDIEDNSLLHYAASECTMDTNTKKNQQILLQFENGFDTDDMHIMKFLIEAGVDPSKRNFHGQIALLIAAYYHNNEAIECLLLKLKDSQDVVFSTINERDCDGRGPLHYAAMYRNYKAITNVIETQLISSTITSFTQKEFDSRFIYRNATEHLLKCGANVNARDKFGCLPLHYACMTYYHLINCEIFGFNSDKWYSLKDSFGNTPFHYAAISGNIHLLLELMHKEGGIALNVLNNQNQSLLHLLAISRVIRNYTISYDRYKCVLNWLIRVKKLDIELEDKNGLVAIEYAHLSNNQDFSKAHEESTHFNLKSSYVYYFGH